MSPHVEVGHAPAGVLIDQEIRFLPLFEKLGIVFCLIEPSRPCRRHIPPHHLRQVPLTRQRGEARGVCRLAFQPQGQHFGQICPDRLNIFPPALGVRIPASRIGFRFRLGFAGVSKMPSTSTPAGGTLPLSRPWQSAPLLPSETPVFTGTLPTWGTLPRAGGVVGAGNVVPGIRQNQGPGFRGRYASTPASRLARLVVRSDIALE